MLPGAFTSTCSTYQRSDFEKLFDEFQADGVDELCCVSVNYTFVINDWENWKNLDKIKLIRDGSVEFTRKVGMLVAKDNVGLVLCSRHYNAVTNDGRTEKWLSKKVSLTTAKAIPTANPSPQHILESLKDDDVAEST